MKHLSRDELIDSLEQTLPPAREAHVENCHVCRTERLSLQQVLGRVKAVDVPEPSPLFWTHFSQRVREQIAQFPQSESSASSAWIGSTGWSRWSWPRWAAAAATLLVCATVGWTGWQNYQRRHLAGASTDAAAYAGARASAETTAPDDADWNWMVSMAEDVTLDDAAEEPAMVLRPGVADRVMYDLSSEQRSELARLLTAEMARPAS